MQMWTGSPLGVRLREQFLACRGKAGLLGARMDVQLANWSRMRSRAARRDGGALRVVKPLWADLRRWVGRTVLSP